MIQPEMGKGKKSKRKIRWVKTSQDGRVIYITKFYPLQDYSGENTHRHHRP